MRRLLLSIAAFVGVWLLGSFLGTMFDPARANLWTTSLMWALLSCVILAPVFLFMGTSESSSNPGRPRQSEDAFEVEEAVDVPDEESQEVEREGWPYE
jgi:hypothetical protein